MTVGFAASPFFLSHGITLVIKTFLKAQLSSLCAELCHLHRWRQSSNKESVPTTTPEEAKCSYVGSNFPESQSNLGPFHYTLKVKSVAWYWCAFPESFFHLCFFIRRWLDLSPSDVMWNTSDTGWAKSAYGSVFSPWICGACVFIHNLPLFQPEIIGEVSSPCIPSNPKVPEYLFLFPALFQNHSAGWFSSALASCVGQKPWLSQE